VKLLSELGNGMGSQCVCISSTVNFTPSHSQLYDIHAGSSDCNRVYMYYTPTCRKPVHVYLLHSYRYLPGQKFDGIVIETIDDA
jgi:hypothetical protein